MPRQFLTGAFMRWSVAEALLVVGFVAWHRIPPDAGNQISVSVLLAVSCLLLAGGGVLYNVINWVRSASRSAHALAFATNIAMLAIMLIATESTLRLAFATLPKTESLLPRGLIPKDWRRVAEHNLQITDSNLNTWPGSFLVPDPELGWTVAPNQASRDGRYFSTVGGIRSAAAGDPVDMAPRRRILLFGDSYTFAMAVRYHETWGHRLEQELANRYQVLNFGVGGYGVDQAYLRMRSAIEDWPADVVILAFIRHDLTRTMSLYTFLSFPSWDFPFSKPKLVADQGDFRWINRPALGPTQLFHVSHVSDLPHLSHEPGYFPGDWQFRWFHTPLTSRFLVSLFPPWPQPAREIDEQIRTHAEILRRFAATARQHGAEPFVVYLPSAGRLATGSVAPLAGGDPVLRIAADAKVDVLDTTKCMMAVNRSSVLADDGVHLSPQANAELARCLAAALPLPEGDI